MYQLHCSFTPNQVAFISRTICVVLCTITHRHCFLTIGTYGCTKEACQFRDAIAGEKGFIGYDLSLLTEWPIEKDTFKPGNAVIVGISADPVEKQKAFVDQQKLTVRARHYCFLSMLTSLSLVSDFE